MNNQKTMRVTHTHRGTCQACGRVQAITEWTNKHSGKTFGNIAKHGYTVNWGFFNGVCMGADSLPLELSKDTTERLIKELREITAPQADKLAVDLADEVVEPDWQKPVEDGVTRWGSKKYKQVSCPKSDLTPYEISRQLEIAIHQAENKARMARSHADFLAHLITKRHGQPLIPVGDSNTPVAQLLKAGTKVQMWGKKDGVLCEVVEIKTLRASGVGPFLNGHYIPHAILKRPTGTTFAYPVRLIRKASIVKDA